MPNVYATTHLMVFHLLQDDGFRTVEVHPGTVLVRVGMIEFEMGPAWNYYRVNDHIFLDSQGRIVSRCNYRPAIDQMIFELS